jgi:hypothetical protein
MRPCDCTSRSALVSSPRFARRVASRCRSAFGADALERALDDERRWELIESSLGSIPDGDREWTSDSASWVRAQRRTDERRLG